MEKSVRLTISTNNFSLLFTKLKSHIKLSFLIARRTNPVHTFDRLTINFLFSFTALKTENSLSQMI